MLDPEGETERNLPGTTVIPAPPPMSMQERLISDERFIAQLDQIKKLKQFLFEQKIGFELQQLQSMDLGNLNNLRFGQRGRDPTLAEWALLDEKLSHLASCLTEELRRKIRIRELGFFFGPMPIYFLLAAVLSTIYLFLYGFLFSESSIAFTASWLFSLVVWTLSQGGLGACAFLGTRVSAAKLEGRGPKSQLDLVDITDRNVLQSRILLGALFGFLFGLPVANSAINEISSSLFANPPAPLSVSDFGIIFVPFLMGFSTNLVLIILDRLVAAVRTIFGVTATE